MEAQNYSCDYFYSSMQNYSNDCLAKKYWIFDDNRCHELITLACEEAYKAICAEDMELREFRWERASLYEGLLEWRIHNIQERNYDLWL